MPHPVNHERRAELLAGIVEYMLQNGVIGLSLRPLAASLGTSPRMLMHYFGSKENMIVTAFDTVRPNITAVTNAIETLHDFRNVATIVWQQMCDGEIGRHVVILLQVLSMPNTDPMRIALGDLINEVLPTWTTPMTAALKRCGIPQSIAEARSTLIIAGFRGLLLDRLTTGDVERTDAAAAEMIALTTLPATGARTPQAQ